MSLGSLQQLCNLSVDAAQTLHKYAHGRDARVPEHKAPPKVLSLQMPLTPVPLPMPAAWSADGTASEINGSKGGMLQPLHLDDGDAQARLMSLLVLMLRDMVVRVVEDRCAQPCKLWLSYAYVYRIRPKLMRLCKTLTAINSVLCALQCKAAAALHDF